MFLDRKFLGTTPVETRAFEPGTHRLNVSAEGYEMYAESVDLAPGPNQVTVRFKEVRLDERVEVTHKHGVGSCRGVLHANDVKACASTPTSPATPSRRPSRHSSRCRSITWQRPSA